ncbi:BTAD domain-containing putative transcriptional regulator [Kutzneria sp. NPDC052558]|uniref:AfsR/SARP family transcriptional regulator n=1 Tax=Kutzneria sp. NPDC052558 TaxID=3364121 RepID=UPI0037C93E3C
MTPALTIRLLGPVRVELGTEVLESGPPQQQATLAVLALNAGTPTPVEQIAAAIWGDRQPSSAYGTVRTCVYRLRKILNGDDARIESSSQGYLLRTAPDVIDLRRFEALVDEARSDKATRERADRLRAAIDLWRGDAFAGLCGEYFEDRRTRLAGERLTAVQDWCEAALELDQADRTVAALHELIATDPFQERSHELLMLALVRLGQRAEALEVYDRIRRRLADELGIDPGPRLRELHERVLRSDPTLLHAPEPVEPAYTPIPAQLPSDVMAFSGRDDEVADALAAAAPVTLIHGTAGIGKTTLAVHVAHLIAADFPDGQLFVNLQGFYHNMSPVPPSTAIRSLLEGLGVPTAQVPDDLPAQTAYYRSVMAGKRCLIVLDNARDSQQVLPLLPGNARCAVIVTTRTMLTQLVMATGAHVIELDLLSPAAAEQFLRARLGSRRVDAEPAAVRQIVAKCARLPLALAITAARAALRPRLPLAGIVDELADAHSSLDAFASPDPDLDVRSVISWSYIALSPEAARLFRMLSLHPGMAFDLAVAANLFGAKRSVVAPLVEELIGAHLIEQPGPRRYSWHDLIRAAAAEELAKHEEDAKPAFSRLLDYYLRSTSSVAAMFSKNHHLPPFRAPEPLAPEPDTFTDYKAAFDWLSERYTTVLELIEQACRHGHPATAWRLAWCIRHFQDRQGHWRDSLAVQTTALKAAELAGEPVGVAYAHRGLARAWTLLKDYAAAETHIKAATDFFESTGDHMEEAYCKRQHSWIVELQGDDLGALALTREAVAIFRDLDWKPGLAGSLNAAAWYEMLTGHAARAIVLGRESVAIFETVADLYGLGEALGTLGISYLVAGEPQLAADTLEQALSLHTRTNSFTDQAGVLRRLVDVHARLGNTARSEELRARYDVLTATLTDEERESIAVHFRLGVESESATP